MSFVWSYSALSAFEICPKKYWHEKIRRDVPEKVFSQRSYGVEGHKLFELRLLKGKALPLDLKHHEKILGPIANAKGTGMPEQKLALNKKLEPTGFFDDDVWVRGVIDYVKVSPPSAILIDHKFGKKRPGFDQLDVMTLLLFHHMPEVKTMTSMFYWALSKTMSPKKYTRADIPVLWNEFLPRVWRMIHAKKTTSYPARPNFLCPRHCPVVSCPHNGG